MSRFISRAEDLEIQLEHALMAKPETGEQWAEICWLEKELAQAREEEARENGQFGVGA